jgi:stress response protein YsnF
MPVFVSTTTEERTMETITTDQLVAAQGADVLDRNGDRIGAIEEIYYDDDTGRAEWVGIGVGIFGLKRRVVPIDGALLDGDTLRVAYDKDMVKDSPDVDDDEISAAREAELYDYYGVGGGTGAGRTGDVELGTAGDVDLAGDRGEREMVRSEEELHVGKRETEAGRVRLRKWVETEPVEERVELRRETAEVIREPIDQPVAGGTIGEEEIEVTLHEEVPVVEKETIARERVSLDRGVEVDEEVVSDDVRRERVEVEVDDPSARRNDLTP